MSNPVSITLHEMGEETTSGSGDSSDLGGLRTAARLVLVVEKVTGTSPTLLVTVETSSDETNWRTVASFAEKSSTSADIISVATLNRYIRVSWTIGGSDSPSFTFRVAGWGHVVYADPVDLSSIGIRLETLGGVSASEQASKLIAASDEADTYLNICYSLPLESWGNSLRFHVARIAASLCMETIGYVSEGADERIVQWRKEGLQWLRMMADGKVSDPDIVDSTPSTVDASSVVYSRSGRGYW